MEAFHILNKILLHDTFDLAFFNKKAFLPANEIITKEYSPDIKPAFKLMIKQQQKSQKNITYVPPKIKNPQFQSYAQKFYPMDFLGYQYADKHEQMVYFRYNNQDFNQLREGKVQKGGKYFAGLFIPLKILASEQFKAEKNIYSVLSLSAPELKETISNSFSKNCKGCSFDPLFSSNFLSGNLMAAIRKKPFEYDIILQNDINCKAAEWFNFAVKFIQEGVYKFNLVNLSNQNPLYQMGMKVPYYSFLQQSLKQDTCDDIKSENGWSFGGRNISFTKTHLRKESQLFDQTYYQLSFQFKCKSRQEIVIFASSIPYTTLDYERFLNRVFFNKIGQYMKMEKICICQTLSGQNLSAYVFYHRKSKSNTLILRKNSQDQQVNTLRSAERTKTLNLSYSSSVNLNAVSNQSNSNGTKTIVFMARQHSGQTPSSFVLQGVIEFLMDNTEFDVFKKNFQFVVIPFINLDGVKYGNQRVNLAGSDLNKSWRNPNSIFEPQSFNVKIFLKKVNMVHPISMIINLASNSQSLSSYFTWSSQKKSCGQVPQLIPYICSKKIPQISFQQSSFSSGQIPSLISNLNEIFPKSLIYEFNTSIYGWKVQNLSLKKYVQSNFTSQENSLIYQFTPEIYRSIGRQLIATYLELAKLCEKNIVIKDRWLKEIQDLSLSSIFLKKASNQFEKNYEQTWDRQIVHLNYSSYSLPLVNQASNQINKLNDSQLKPKEFQNCFEGRSKSKKLTIMPTLKNSRFSKDFKQDSPLADNNSFKISGPGNNSNLAVQKRKKSVLSSIFTSKTRSEILKQVSKPIKQAPFEKQNQFAPKPVNLSKLQVKVQKKDNKQKKLIQDHKNEVLVPQTLTLKQQQNTLNSKIENMKKLILAMDYKPEAKTSFIQKA